MSRATHSDLPPRAWQKDIRDKRANEDADADLFGRWWEGLDLTLSKSVVREIGAQSAKSIIEKYEWLGTMPAIVLHCYGIFFDGALGGAAVYSTEYAENLGVWDKYGFTGKIICLSRGACAHWTPIGAASRLTRRSMDLLPAKYEVITATTDHAAGEVGTIYQAAGFYSAKMNTHARYQIEGVPSRTLRLSGINNKSDIEASGLKAKLEYQKGRYFAFRGPRAAVRKHRKAIAHLIQPFPKRADRQEDEQAPTCASVVQSHGSAPDYKDAA